MNPAGGSRQEKERYSRDHRRNAGEEVARPLVETSRIPAVPHEAVPAGHGVEGEDFHALDPVKEEGAHDRMAQTKWSAVLTTGAMKYALPPKGPAERPSSRPVEKIEEEDRHGGNGNTGNKEFIKRVRAIRFVITFNPIPCHMAIVKVSARRGSRRHACEQNEKTEGPSIKERSRHQVDLVGQLSFCQSSVKQVDASFLTLHFQEERIVINRLKWQSSGPYTNSIL